MTDDDPAGRPAGAAELVACVGCGALVTALDGATHRYIGASPGCWARYSELLVGGQLAGARLGPLAVDAYAVQHPGVPGPQSTQSVWVHLVTLALVLEGGWRIDQAVRLRTAAVPALAGRPWLEPPAERGQVTAIDVFGAVDGGVAELVTCWVEGAWAAWATHHDAVRAATADVVATVR